MSAVMSAVQVRCDWCGAISAQIPLADSGIIAESRLPDGWRGIGYGSASIDPYYRVRLRDPAGCDIGHLCPDCCARPAGDLIRHLSEIAATIGA